MTYQGHKDQHFGHVSYAQHGDDFMVLNLFKMLGVEKPSYIDLGAHHPETLSNTKLLYDRGSRGVNVEANPLLIDAFRKHRPEDINVDVGVGRISGHATFYMYSDRSGRNTFSSQEVQSVKDVLTVKDEIIRPITTLAEIIDQYSGGAYPDFLSCDIEGLDFDVLSGADLSPPLAVICVETRRQETDRMAAMLDRKGFFLYCRMGENLFFVRNNLKPLVY